MKKILGQIFIVLLLGLLIFLSFSTTMPHPRLSKKIDKTKFSTERAFAHVKKIGQAPHYVGSKDHSQVRNYIVGQLQDLGLTAHTQNGYVVNTNGVMTNPENIVTRLKGSDPQPGDDLLVLAHYDSDPHSSFGASDDGSGVAAILESLRAYMAKAQTPKNNIVVCFTDAEEIGLLGAKLFSEQHPWAKDIGLVINFEARGTSGPSNTIIETNHGNARLVKTFAAAKPPYPVASSLMYEIYRNMPNDTDATVFREEDDLSSFFFAFIDGHYNYHTANDLPKNLDKESLAQQGSYLTALLPYLGSHRMSDIRSDKNQVYFNFPIFKLIHYSYTWIYPLLALGWVLFLILIVVGFRKGILNFKGIKKGVWALLLSLLFCAGFGYFGWKLIMAIYPQYGEIQQGFPYNGHAYIAAFVFFGLAILFEVYRRFQRRNNHGNLFVAPLLLWLIINTGLAVAFKGASYFIIPVIFAELAFFLMIALNKSWSLLMLVLGIPALFIFSPLIEYLPVALGTHLIFTSLLLLVLLFGLLWPLFAAFHWKNILAILCLIGGIVYIVVADKNSGFDADHPKPNSLVYLLDADKGQATWNTYDHILDDWTKTNITGVKDTTQFSVMGSKYGESFTYSNPAEMKPIPTAEIDIQRDTVRGKLNYRLNVSLQRKVNRLIIYGNIGSTIKNFTVNSVPLRSPTTFHSKIRKAKTGPEMRLLTYYPVDQAKVELRFELPLTTAPRHLTVYEATNNLLDNPWLNVPKRQEDMMPRPFVLNDAVVTKKTINL